MTVQEYIIESTDRAVEEFFRYAKGISDEKLDWSPEGARSVLSLCRELTMTPTWAIGTIDGSFKHEDWNEETMKAMEEEQSQWKTVEDCETECKKRLEVLYAYYREIDDSRMATETKFLPYEGGRDFTMAEMMEYPRWNFNYHTGQVAYIQTMLGDNKMY